MSNSRTPPELDQLFAKLLEDELQPAEGEQLDRALRDDPAVRLLYRKYMTLDAMLRWEIAPPLMRMGDAGSDECGMMNDELPVDGVPADIHHSSFIIHHSDVPGPEPLIPPIIVDPFPAFHSPLGGWLFSYAVATVLTGVAVLGAWLYRVSQDDWGTEPRSPMIAVFEGDKQPQVQVVGKITGMADCRLADPPAAPLGASISLGQTYALRSGLMEITYQTGARVILQGPCTYEVESSRGGFLSLGKLTARVETKGEGGRGKAEVRSQMSEVRSQESPLPSPPSTFVVRTPTAVVTDLGTEFGVEVSGDHRSKVHVFEGKVVVRAADGTAAKPGPRVLTQGESALVDVQGAVQAGFGAPGVKNLPAQFVRHMPRPNKFGVLDLLDIVAGGDGTGRLRAKGIDPATGEKVETLSPRPPYRNTGYHAVAWNRLVDGVFVPDTKAGPVQLDSAGHRFAGFGMTTAQTHSPIWARAADAGPDEYAANRTFWMYTVGRRFDLAPEGRGLLAMHSNVGLTFDLDAVRKAHPDLVRVLRFRAGAGVGHEKGSADIWVFVDGQKKYERKALQDKDGPARVEVELAPGDRFLTLVVTDGNDALRDGFDWVVFGDPTLYVAIQQQETSERPKAENGRRQKEGSAMN